MFCFIQKHDPPVSSIPCLHYKKMKDQEERELNGEVTSNAEESHVKLGEEVVGEERAAKSEEEEQDALLSGITDQDGESAAENSLQNKESLPCDTAQGALGQVKAKVEVCKDESIGRGFSKTASMFSLIQSHKTLYVTSFQNLKIFVCTLKNVLTLNKSLSRSFALGPSEDNSTET